MAELVSRAQIKALSSYRGLRLVISSKRILSKRRRITPQDGSSKSLSPLPTGRNHTAPITRQPGAVTGSIFDTTGRLHTKTRFFAKPSGVSDTSIGLIRSNE